MAVMGLKQIVVQCLHSLMQSGDSNNLAGHFS